MEKAPTRAFSLLKIPTSTFTLEYLAIVGASNKERALVTDFSEYYENFHKVSLTALLMVL